MTSLEGAPVRPQVGSLEWFQNADNRIGSLDVVNAAGILHRGAVAVFGEEKAESAKLFMRMSAITGIVSKAAVERDPLLAKLAPALVSTGKVVGLYEGSLLSAVSARLYIDEVEKRINAREDFEREQICKELLDPMKEDLERFEGQYLEREESEIARYLGYLVLLPNGSPSGVRGGRGGKNNDRKSLLGSLSNTQVSVRFNAWERLAVLAKDFQPDLSL